MNLELLPTFEEFLNEQNILKNSSDKKIKSKIDLIFSHGEISIDNKDKKALFSIKHGLVIKKDDKDKQVYFTGNTGSTIYVITDDKELYDKILLYKS